jgi:hypothetical protein
MGVLNFRKYSRVEVEIPIRFLLPGSDQPVSVAYLNNLSEEGAGMICPFAIPIATTLEFDIQLPNSDTPARVRADVLWFRPVNENGQNVFVHGLLFNRVEIDDRERIHVFILSSMSY